MKTRNGKLLVVLAALALFVFSGGSALAQDPIVLGCPLSTAFLYGWDAERGVTLAVEEINAKGGVNVGGTKRPFKVETIDTRDLEPGVPVSEALLAVEKLILDKKADFIVGGPVRSEAALAATRFDPSGRSFEEALLRFRDLLKFEFSFKPKDEFVRDAVEYLDDRYPAWRRRSDALAAGPRPLFGQTILRSFVEAYSVLAAWMAGHGSEPIIAGNGAIVEGCLVLGQELLLRRRISSEAALSGPLFETGIRLANHRRLLDARDEGLAGRRESFSAEIDRALDVMDRLQQVYDRRLEDPAQDQYYSRSIA